MRVEGGGVARKRERFSKGLGDGLQPNLKRSQTFVDDHERDEARRLRYAAVKIEAEFLLCT